MLFQPSEGAALSPAERMARLRLARSENIGPVTFRDLIGHYGNAINALDAIPELARRGGARARIRIADAGQAEAELAQIKKIGAELLVLGDGIYPQLLAALDPPPPLILLKGNMGLLEKRAIAIVGSRHASAAGMRIAANIANDLGTEGFAVVSGLARGIDTAAHQASLKTGTIAVVAGGIDIFYPQENRALQESISKQGLIISEMPPGTSPQARHFPRRNRLISGLSLATVVVEAALRSGSLITARYALEQGREVFAVPGSPVDPRAQGGNRLIKDGAPLVESAGDIIEALANSTGDIFREREILPYLPDAEKTENPSDSMRKHVLEALGPTPTHIDDIVRQAEAPIPLVRMVMLELELAGRLHREPGGYVSLIPE